VDNLFTKRGYSHEIRRVQEYQEFLEEYSNDRNLIYDSLFLKKEEDVAVLPYKPENARFVNRRFSVQSLINNNKYKLEQAFAIVAHCSLSKSGKTYKKVISLLKKDRKTKKAFNVIKPEIAADDYVEFKFETNPIYLYIPIIKISNGKTYACQPIINRSFKHYTQRTKDNLFDIFKSENKIGMLCYHYKAIMDQNEIVKSPVYPLDIYEISLKDLNFSKEYPIDSLIEILILIKNIQKNVNRKKEKMYKRQILNDTPTTFSSSETSTTE